MTVVNKTSLFSRPWLIPIKFIGGLIIGLSLFVTNTSQANSTAYIASNQAKLLAQPKFTAPTQAILTKGTPITVIHTKGPWAQVKAKIPAGEKQGWISKFIISKTPPIDRVTVLPGNKEIKLKDIRRRTSAITTAAAARGLADVSRGTKQDRYVSNPKAVEYMESIKISPRELNRFAQPIEQQSKGGES